MFNNFFKTYFILISILAFLCCIFRFYFFNSKNDFSDPPIYSELDSDTNYFNWPLPKNHYITSYFGPRKSPTSRSLF